MLEIIIIYVLCKKIAGIVKAKGYKAGWFIFMFIAFWFGGEFGGGIAGGILSMIASGGRQEPAMLMIYLFALVGAALGAGIAFLIVNALHPAEMAIEPEGADDRYDEDDSLPPRRPEDIGEYYDPKAHRRPLRPHSPDEENG